MKNEVPILGGKSLKDLSRKSVRNIEEGKSVKNLKLNIHKDTMVW